MLCERYMGGDGFPIHFMDHEYRHLTPEKRLFNNIAPCYSRLKGSMKTGTL